MLYTCSFFGVNSLGRSINSYDWKTPPENCKYLYLNGDSLLTTTGFFVFQIGYRSGVVYILRAS